MHEKEIKIFICAAWVLEWLKETLTKIGLQIEHNFENLIRQKKTHRTWTMGIESVNMLFNFSQFPHSTLKVVIVRLKDMYNLIIARLVWCSRLFVLHFLDK